MFILLVNTNAITWRLRPLGGVEASTKWLWLFKKTRIFLGPVRRLRILYNSSILSAGAVFRGVRLFLEIKARERKLFLDF